MFIKTKLLILSITAITALIIGLSGIYRLFTKADHMSFLNIGSDDIRDELLKLFCQTIEI